MFGPHLMVDAVRIPKKKLLDMEFIYEFLDTCPDKIDMTKIAPPHIVQNKLGLAGMILIAESHISVHTDAKENKLHIDIFSCKDFSERKAINYIIKFFGLKKYNKEFIHRGKNFPRWS